MLSPHIINTHHISHACPLEVYGNAVPADPNVTLQEGPMLSQKDLLDLQNNGTINWSLYNQSRCVKASRKGLEGGLPTLKSGGELVALV